MLNRVEFLDWRSKPIDDFSLLICDPVYADPMVDEVWKWGCDSGRPTVVFMYPEDVWDLSYKPQQIVHWTKPISTKNTVKNYSKFVEVACLQNCVFQETLHWSNRSGIFTDRILDNSMHPWKKPESLIETLIRNHYPKNGVVLDVCAGSGTVHNICRRLQIPSLCFELDPKYKPFYEGLEDAQG